MNFRPAVLEDLAEVANFPQNATELFFVYPTAHFPLSVQQLLPNFCARKGNTVALFHEKIVGYANYIKVIEGESATIGNVIVAGACRGQGVGMALIEYMSNIARDRFGVRTIQIPCFNTNSIGLLFYHKLGFVPVKGEPRVDHNHQPVYLLWLTKALTNDNHSC